MATVVAAVSSPKLAIYHQDDLKKRFIRITATWRNGSFGKLNDHLVLTKPNHQHSKMDVLPKTFVQIILAAKWLVRHSSTSPNQQRRPLSSLLSLSFFYSMTSTGPATNLMIKLRVVLPVLVHMVHISSVQMALVCR